jgi:hypothetical protein
MVQRQLVSPDTAPFKKAGYERDPGMAGLQKYLSSPAFFPASPRKTGSLKRLMAGWTANLEQAAVCQFAQWMPLTC